MSQLISRKRADAITTASNPPLNIVMFYHSVISDWNNGNAHFLRGVVKELSLRGHHVVVYEPRDCWSMSNLESEVGASAENKFHDVFPEIRSVRYLPGCLQLEEVLDGADLVLVHEWNEHALVSRIGQHHLRNPYYRLLFHDTHHRSVTDEASMANYDLSNYDGVLAFGRIIRDLYLERGWIQNAWTWHEAADITTFFPQPQASEKKDILWIGNWGDEERTAELEEFFFQPVADLNLEASAFGVRYPDEARQKLARLSVSYGGWIPNHLVPDQAARHRIMIHVPRRPYASSLPGIPTIRMFEAMACGIPLVSAPWQDDENLFVAGEDYLLANNSAEMKANIADILNDKPAAERMAKTALRTIMSQHTCGHRVEELLQIYSQINQTKLNERADLCPAAQ